MEITREQLAEWKALYAHGDYIKIADKFCTAFQRVSQQTARNWVKTALKTGICDDRLYPVIEKFYNGIKKQLKTSK